MSRHAAAAVLDESTFPAPLPVRPRRAPRRRSVPVSPGRVRLTVVRDTAAFTAAEPVTPPASRRPVLRRAVRAARSLVHRRPAPGGTPMLLAIATGLAFTAATLGVLPTAGLVGLAVVGTGVCELLDHANRS
ncbi:hypothetical protein [Allokutzneria albata]|uniref:Uncharacterized protein n=1 Tax=Allokutzneria albata TaxID=211114 RepID=A0A1G9VWX7_ALLAB|nr:hypothetical protein [Allokutzneria albata]SDM76792.1 hypothetical protein SAMN04489726_3282 [Allokutzneria albata]